MIAVRWFAPALLVIGTLTTGSAAAEPSSQLSDGIYTGFLSGCENPAQERFRVQVYTHEVSYEQWVMLPSYAPSVLLGAERFCLVKVADPVELPTDEGTAHDAYFQAWEAPSANPASPTLWNPDGVAFDGFASAGGVWNDLIYEAHFWPVPGANPATWVATWTRAVGAMPTNRIEFRRVRDGDDLVPLQTHLGSGIGTATMHRNTMRWTP